jgi:hypothetical protein
MRMNSPLPHDLINAANEGCTNALPSLNLKPPSACSSERLVVTPHPLPGGFVTGPIKTTSAESSDLLTAAELCTLSLASLGGALEFYDFIVFVFFIAVIGKLFFPASLPDWMRQLKPLASLPQGIWHVRWAAL